MSEQPHPWNVRDWTAIALLPCGHWGTVKLSRNEWNEWRARGMPQPPGVGVPDPCEQCDREKKQSPAL